MPAERLAECIERIDVLLSKVEALPDVALRQDVQEIVECLLDYHRAALARLLSLVPGGSHAAPPIVARFAQDELVASLLVLHGLHPADLESRVLEGLAHARPYLESHGGNVELASIVEGVVHLRLKGCCHGCPSSAATMKSRVEQAIYEIAPEVEAVELDVDDQPPPPAGGFVAMESLAIGSGAGARNA